MGILTLSALLNTLKILVNGYTFIEKGMHCMRMFSQKKLFYLLVVYVGLVGTSFGDSSVARAHNGPKMRVTVAESTEQQIGQEKKSKTWKPENLHINIAGGEYETIQLVVWAQGVDLKETSIWVDGLTAKSGLETEVFLVDTNGALLPVQEVEIPKGGCKAFVIRYRAMKSGRPGTYSNTVTVSALSVKKEVIPVTVNRYAFNLDETGNLPCLVRNGLQIDPKIMDKQRMPRFAEAFNVYDEAKLLARHSGLCPADALWGSVTPPKLYLYEDGSMVADWLKWEFEVKRHFVREPARLFTPGMTVGSGTRVRNDWLTHDAIRAETGAMTAVSIDPYSDSSAAGRFDYLLTGYRNTLQRTGYLDMSFITVWENAVTVAASEQAILWARRMRPYVSGIKLACSIEKMPSKEVANELFNAYDVFIINPNDITLPFAKSIMGDADKQLWFDCEFAEDPNDLKKAARLRTLGWLAWNYGISALSVRDVNEVMSYMPETRKPLSTLELEALRDGLEDYGYLSKLAALDNTESRRLLAEIESNFDYSNFEHQVEKPKQLRKLRDCAGALISKFKVKEAKK